MKQIIPEFIKQPVRVLRNSYLMRTVRIHPAPIIVLGHQKTGTSVIAALLGEATGKSVTIDMFHHNNKIRPFFREDIFNKKLSLRDFIQANALYFSTDIIKEPDLTFHYEALLNYFPKAKFVFVIRDPRDNIRSILNRLKISGNLQKLNDCDTEQLQGLKGWQFIIEGKFPDVTGQNYIEKLAQRWNLAADVYLQNKDHIVIIRYEDFVKDKINIISHLARQLGLEPIHDISNKVDVQYQSRGNHKISRIEFFGIENLKLIEKICRDKMQKFDYLL